MSTTTQAVMGASTVSRFGNSSTTMTAKFAGTCVGCHQRIHVGDQIEWSRGAGARHVHCPEVETQSDAIAFISSERTRERTISISPGVFRKDGRIYVVKQTRKDSANPDAPRRLYAKEIIESAKRITEDGEQADFESVYARGVVYDLTEADRWDWADASAFLTKYARCIVCNAHLKAAKSVAGAIGPVCAKYFKHKHAEAA